MIGYIKVIGTWLVLTGHVLFGWWIRSKVDGSNDAKALRAGNAGERKAPATKDELEEALKEGKL